MTQATRPCRAAATCRRMAAACGLALLAAAGCAPAVDHPRPLDVVLSYPPKDDVEQNLPSIRTLNDPAVEGYVRQSLARREIDGRVYQGEQIEVTQVKEFGAPGETVFEIVARRFADPDPYIDIRVTSAVRWRLAIGGFLGGRLVDAGSGRRLPSPHTFPTGTYHLRAYK